MRPLIRFGTDRRRGLLEEDQLLQFEPERRRSMTPSSGGSGPRQHDVRQGCGPSERVFREPT